MFKVEVIADNSGKWCSNQVEYGDEREAINAGNDLARRWTAVRKWRVVRITQRPVCATCGGTEGLKCDATAEWNDGAQDWSLCGLSDRTYCDDCDAECDTEWHEVAREVVHGPAI